MSHSSCIQYSSETAYKRKEKITKMDFYGWIIVGIILIVTALYWYSTKKYQYWSSRGINGPTPTFLLGNMLAPMRRSMADFDVKWAKQYGKIYGIYHGLKPVLTILDHKLIRQMLVKDFPLFVNRRENTAFHEIFSLNLFGLEGEKWRRVRSITSPTFTSGKLRSMHLLMNRCIEKFDSYLQKVTDPKNPDSGVIDVKNVVSGFTIDVNCSALFATETNANDDKTSRKDNQLILLALKFFQFSKLKVAAILAFPLWLNKLLGVKNGSPTESMDYFVNLSQQIVTRRLNGKPGTKKRNDLVQLLLEASIDESELANGDYSKLTATGEHDSQSETKLEQNGNSPTNLGKLNENEIVAQCIVYFMAGFETTATAITHIIYELAVNQDVQQRLLDEIQKQVGDQDQNSEQFYDNVLIKIPYLDAVIKEALRKYPPVPRLNRRLGVNKYTLGGVELFKDQLVQIPSYAVHHMEEYYPEPERFNPNRFMPENKDKLVPYTYLPFGEGPRNCVGQRFAYQEIKLFLSLILPRYRFETTAQTAVPLKFLHGLVVLNSGPIPIKVSRR